MRRFILPLIGILAAAWAAYAIVHTTTHRESTIPPSPPPVSDFRDTVAAVGLVEASTENIAIGTSLSGIVPKVFVGAGDAVRAGDPLCEVDTRQLRAELDVRRQTLAVARSRARVADARLDDLRRQLSFAEQVKDKRAVSAEELSRRRSAVDTAAAELDEARAQVAAAEAQVRATAVEIERSTVRSPIDAQVLQVKLRVGAAAVGRLRGNAELKTPLSFVRFEPFVVPKKSLTGDSTERVDTRVLQVIYKVEQDDLPLFVGEQLDVFIDAGQVALR